MKNKSVYISFIILLLTIIFSYLKINYYIQKNNINSNNIVRYGKNKNVGDIININGNKELVIEVLKDGSYITKRVN
nr:hypothetical protein [uncultured Tyzzerella sp.]